MSEETVFTAALAKQSLSERAAYLDEACAGNPALRSRVEALLKSHDEAASFLGTPAVTVDQPSNPAADDGTPASATNMEAPGTRIGVYKLLQVIGEGGMGAVYMAEQERPVRRRVAFKIIKPGMDSAQVVARFEAERQALALMDHQNIAKVFDAGTTDTGRPYFVMELVKGVPITKFCDDNHLTPRQRLELFVPVCQAVQHAHQKGVIHRDLKPSNVLVTLYDGKPVPKVIDFGVAKATHQRLTERTMFTEFGSVVGTLEYMSPEQAEMNALDIDTRSDVYSLGVLLYELLTGTTPLDKKRLRSAAFTEMLRLIREEEPPKPSTRLSQSGEALSTISAQRQTEPSRLPKLVRGEVDWIVMKALEKDRTRRYETASGLARDIERYLHDEAVEACPPSAAYRLRKFARRYRAAFVTAAAFALLLLAGAGVSTWQAVRAMQAERAALLEQNRAEDARQEALANEQKARDQEKKAAELAFEMMELLQVFQNQVRDVTAAFKDGGKLDQAVSFYEQAVAAVTAKHGPAHESTFISSANLGVAYVAAGKVDRALALAELLLPVMKAGPGLDHPATFWFMGRLAGIYEAAGKRDRAIALHQENLATMKASLPPDHIVLTSGLANLADAYWAAGSRDKALPLWEQVIEIQRAHMGSDAPKVLRNTHNLAGLYQDAGHPDKAVPLYEQVLAKRKATLGPDHSDTIATMFRLAQAHAMQGDYAKAEPLYLDVLALQRKRLDKEHPELAGALADLVLNQLRLKKFAEAEPLARECLRIREKTLTDDWRIFNARAMLGGALLGQNKYVEAEPLLVQGYEGMKQREDTIPADGKSRLHEALERLVQVSQALGKPNDATKWRKELEAVRSPAAEKKP